MLQQLIEVTPDAPYAELSTTATVALGDIKRFVYGDRWEGAGGHEIGKKVSEVTDWIFARVAVPDGYRLCNRRERTTENDLCWRSDNAQWVDVSAVWPSIQPGVLLLDLHRVVKEEGGKVYFATPEIPAPAVGELRGARIKLLEGHRWMDIGEVARKGDRYRMVDDDQWRTVDMGQAGFAVPDKCEDNGFISYCRPINPTHRFWHISSSGSDETGRGTLHEPWATKEHALARIARGVEQLGMPLYGTIIDESWAGVHHFDMDAPDIIAPSVAVDPVKGHAQPREDGTTASGAGKVSLPRKKRLRPAHWSSQNISRFIKRLTTDCPLYRVMCIGDRLKESDMVCVREQGRWQWRSVGSVFQSGIGMPVDECPWIAARAYPPEEGMNKEQAAVSLVEHHLGQIYEILASLKK